MTVKMAIKELRLASNKTQRELAVVLGITETNYRKLENNHVKSISFETIQFLCKYFDCGIQDIIEVVESTTP